MYQTSIRNKKKLSLFNQNRDNDYKLEEAYEEYAYVIKILGNCRVIVIANNGCKNIGIIRGSLRKFNKRILIEKSDIVVISKRDYQVDKVDIVHKFNSEQSNNLIKENKLSNILVNLYNNKKSYEDITNEDLNKDIIDNTFNDNIIIRNDVDSDEDSCSHKKNSENFIQISKLNLNDKNDSDSDSDSLNSEYIYEL